MENIYMDCIDPKISMLYLNSDLRYFFSENKILCKNYSYIRSDYINSRKAYYIQENVILHLQ